MQVSDFLLESAPRIGIATAVVGTLVGIAAVSLSVRRSDHAIVPAIGALALAAIAPALGLFALAAALHAADAASVGQGRGTRAQGAALAHERGTSEARDGAYCAIAPLLLGAIALVASRKRHVAGWIAVGLSALTAGAAGKASMQRGPVDPGERQVRLMDARDLVDVDRPRGCAALSRVVAHDFAWEPTKGPLPPEIRATVPDYEAVANKCARWGLAEGTLGSDADHSPLLVDDAFRTEVLEDVDLHPCTFGCGASDDGDDFGGFGVIGLGPKHNQVRFVTEARTETGPTDYPPAVLRRIVARAPTRLQLRRCPETTPGNVTVTLTIQPSGKVATVTSTPQSSVDAGPAITNPDLVACVVHAMEALTFPPPDGTVTVTFPIAFDRLK